MIFTGKLNCQSFQRRPTEPGGGVNGSNLWEIGERWFWPRRESDWFVGAKHQIGPSLAGGSGDRSSPIHTHKENAYLLAGLATPSLHFFHSLLSNIKTKIWQSPPPVTCRELVFQLARIIKYYPISWLSIREKREKSKEHLRLIRRRRNSPWLISEMHFRDPDYRSVNKWIRITLV